LYRLNVVELKMPPLRERPGDIPELARHFLKRFSEESGQRPRTLSDAAVALLEQHPFPGNVRELKNLMERVNIYADSDLIEPELLRGLVPALPDGEFPPLKEATRRFELEYIRTAIARAEGNYARAARDLGLERSHLYKKLKQLEQED
jgi:DNA-binding NtrC family response regulator